MGPVGLLCVQRTLKKGQWHGFFSGIGAAFSDLLYAGITSLGMGFVIDLITTQQYYLQIIGSALLLIFGIYVFRSNPFKWLHESQENVNSYPQDTLTAFLLTLSNPLIIFLFIALFARFNFIATEEKLFSILLGLAGILVGALSWWFLITFLVGKLRKIMTLRGLWIMNRIMGIFIIVLSVYLLFVSVFLTSPTASRASAAGASPTPRTASAAETSATP
ncbi:MAG: LysE family translocator [Candidatus Azobacteroides sp.]|nr:LysE family translocator [Candidatus Azobacteroides sp.]